MNERKIEFLASAFGGMIANGQKVFVVCRGTRSGEMVIAEDNDDIAPFILMDGEGAGVNSSACHEIGIVEIRRVKSDPGALITWTTGGRVRHGIVLSSNNIAYLVAPSDGIGVTSGRHRIPFGEATQVSSAQEMGRRS